MPVECIGMIHTNDGSESRPRTTPLLDPDFTRRHAEAHEDAGFDRVLIGSGSAWPEGTQVAAHVAAHAQRLGLLVAHRPGFVFPTLAARQFATPDRFSGGRVAVHVITGGNDAEQRRDGDYLGMDERYARTDEIASVRAAAAAAGRPAPGISVSFRPILGPTEELAWERAHRILEAIENPGSQRLLAAAAQGDLHDRALWTATARASGAGGNSTALVGTPDTVAQALLDYVAIGVGTLLIRGYDPLEDATDYGRELIPLVRAEVARQDAAAAGQAGAEAELAGRP